MRLSQARVQMTRRLGNCWRKKFPRCNRYLCGAPPYRSRTIFQLFAPALFSGRLTRQRSVDKTFPVKQPNSQSQASHQELILDQFTRQAEAFATAPAITN